MIFAAVFAAGAALAFVAIAALLAVIALAGSTLLEAQANEEAERGPARGAIAAAAWRRTDAELGKPSGGDGKKAR